MEIVMYADKRYSDKRSKFTFRTWEEDLLISFDGGVEPTYENDYDPSRKIEIDKWEFIKSVDLVTNVPNIETKVSMKRDSWNSYVEGNVSIRNVQGLLVIEIENDEYAFEQEELLAVIHTFKY